MNRDFLLRLAERVREMIPCAGTDVAKEQLRVWAEEFEEQATSAVNAAVTPAGFT